LRPKVAPGVLRLRQDRLNNDVLIQGNMYRYVLLLPQTKLLLPLMVM
jgi:hypothetical protein